MDLPALYVTTTERVLNTLSISHEAGHLGGGLVIYAATLALVGVRRVSVLPLVMVILVELFNECVQASYYGSWRTADTLADAAWTVLVPLALYLHAVWLDRRRAQRAVFAFTPRTRTHRQIG